MEDCVLAVMLLTNGERSPGGLAARLILTILIIPFCASANF
jgi:hypothetical protein